ncbi:MAG: hypothetical protein QG657_4046, partial [Acidobacteriota bacterium]|nr:hypothetical protein [Acidobacteriota bacterium]
SIDGHTLSYAFRIAFASICGWENIGQYLGLSPTRGAICGFAEIQKNLPDLKVVPGS